jgi:very-short-patch-repair endonuclease
MDYNAPKMKLLRKNLRNNGTSAEATLWNALKSRQIDGFKWRRQYSVGSYILDFYCVEARLGIELDGSPHFTPDGMEKDFLRKTFLDEEHDIEILHIENNLIWNCSDLVISHIRECLQQRVRKYK